MLEPLVVEETSEPDRPVMMLKKAGAYGVQEPSENSISPGTQSVESNVKLVFRISAK